MSQKKPTHASMEQFSVSENILMLGNIPVTQLVNRVGHTPFYAYDRNIIANKIKLLRDSLPSELNIHYAIKANPMPALVHYMSGLVDGFDLASKGEMKIALDTKMSSDKISFAGPGKRQDEINSAIAAGVTINIESQSELSRILAGAEKTGIKPKIAIRVNPDFELKSSGMKMGGGPKQFGIDAEIVPDVLKEISTLDIEFVGFHIFSGSQNLSHEAIIDTQNKTFDLAIKLSKYTKSPVKKLNIGGGFGIPYFPGESHLDITPIGEHLDKKLDQIKSDLPNAKIIIELGRYLVGEAGIYISQIIEKKISRGETFLITDGGLHHHLAASGNFGQVIRKNYPLTIGNKVNGQKETVNVVGPLCTPLDILANKMELTIAEPGDLVVVFQSGAYGYTASPISFLSHPPPEEILV